MGSYACQSNLSNGDVMWIVHGVDKQQQPQHVALMVLGINSQGLQCTL